MPRAAPTRAQDFLSSVLLPLFTVLLLPISLVAIASCVINDKIRPNRADTRIKKPNTSQSGRLAQTSVQKGVEEGSERGCVIISGGRMTKGLTWV